MFSPHGSVRLTPARAARGVPGRLRPSASAACRWRGLPRAVSVFSISAQSVIRLSDHESSPPGIKETSARSGHPHRIPFQIKHCNTVCLPASSTATCCGYLEQCTVLPVLCVATERQHHAARCRIHSETTAKTRHTFALRQMAVLRAGAVQGRRRHIKPYTCTRRDRDCTVELEWSSPFRPAAVAVHPSSCRPHHQLVGQ